MHVTSMREILSFCEREQDWLLETIRALVSAESPTHDKDAVDACGRLLAQRLEACGARVTRTAQGTAGDHLRAQWGDKGKPILILGHFDTVWDVGQLAAMPLREEDGRLHGPGVFDMKAGLSLGMQAIRALAHSGALAHTHVVMLLTTDEEMGSNTSRALIEAEARSSAAVLVLEPSLPGGAVKTSRKGCGDFDLIVRGISAHAGIDPGKGASAIRELARQILRIETLQDVERGVTINVGMVSGGTRPNVVPDEARAVIDVRVPTMADASAVDAALRGLAPELPGTSLVVTGSIDRPPLERTEAVVRLYQLARQIAAELGHALGEGGTGGGSDGNFTAALGIPTLDGLGAVGDGAHARHEHVIVRDLPWRAALIAGLVDRLSSGA
jgi:glutamate carboxypeptidase